MWGGGYLHIIHYGNDGEKDFPMFEDCRNVIFNPSALSEESVFRVTES